MWQVYALLAAVFAALTAIFSKLGVRDVDSGLATAIRVGFILLLTWCATGGSSRSVSPPWRNA